MYCDWRRRSQVKCRVRVWEGGIFIHIHPKCHFIAYLWYSWWMKETKKKVKQVITLCASVKQRNSLYSKTTADEWPIWIKTIIKRAPFWIYQLLPGFYKTKPYRHINLIRRRRRRLQKRRLETCVEYQRPIRLNAENANLKVNHHPLRRRQRDSKLETMNSPGEGDGDRHGAQWKRNEQLVEIY